MKFTVMRSAQIRSWPIHEHGGRGYVLDASAALQRPYSVDAHFWPGASPMGRRLSTEAVGRVPVILEAFVADFDCPAVHGTKEPAPPAWRESERVKLAALEAEHPGAFAYESRGGHRAIFALPEPVELCGLDDMEAWSRFYRIALVYLERRFGMVGDPACSDWTRLYRLPRATRDPAAGPEARPTHGDPTAIGALVFEPTDSDVERAAAMVRRSSGKTVDFTTPSIVDRGLLFWLLEARGDVGKKIERAGRAAWICRCPNRQNHTTKSDGTDSTILYAASGDGEIGAISCQHAHCREKFSVKDWLAFFTDDEKRAARERAGIRTKGKAAA